MEMEIKFLKLGGGGLYFPLPNPFFLYLLKCEGGVGKVNFFRFSRLFFSDLRER